VIELNHALGDIEGVMVGQRYNASAEFYSMRTLGRCGEKHFGRSDHFPTGRMMFPTPEFVIAESVDLFR
jgi:hypothetical protein